MINFLDEIEQHFKEWYPKEGCGVIGVVKGELKWFPCDNVASVNEDFIIDSKQYIAISKKCDIVGIVHSHPDSTPEPSAFDIKYCNALGIPYYIFNYPEMDMFKLEPVRETKSLYGREYELGVNDCFSASVDYYKSIGLNISNRPLHMPKERWWNEGENYFTEENIKTWGFKAVEDSMKEGDLLVFKLMANVANHCGVYLGEDIFYHHALNRISCRENLFPNWKKHIIGVYRYES
jgi:proteasome lid subunit RPN8/RPN11